jgi:hypothetical protein
MSADAGVAGDAVPVDLTDDRDVRALTECMAAYEQAPGVYGVLNADGEKYIVDASTGVCTCPDAGYNLGPDECCKHARRVAFRTGDREVPAWIDVNGVGDLLADHLDLDGQEADR